VLRVLRLLQVANLLARDFCEFPPLVLFSYHGINEAPHPRQSLWPVLRKPLWGTQLGTIVSVEMLLKD
jgi:hypothetical protein